MITVDPMPYIIAAGVICFALGYAAGKLRSRYLLDRYTRRYGSRIVTRAR